jgi:LysR family transcriptional activator of nhaA
VEWFNYHHLLYFWLVAREGSLARASSQLRLAQSTVSGQIRAFEETLGEKLFVRSGRRLMLSEMGRVVFRYADAIFGLGRELQEVLKGRTPERSLVMQVGIADVLPKLVAHRLLEPALEIPGLRLVCREDRPERLLAELAVHGLDVVLADSAVPPTVRVKAFNHLLGECGVTFFGSKALADKYRRNFPGSLAEAPLLLPTENTTIRRSIDQWFATHSIRPRIMGEFEDSALLKVFGQAGMGLFPAPSVITKEVVRQFQVRALGVLDGVRERFYAITVERKIRHPGVVAISEEARHKLFTLGAR